jgi:hypothetical protein
MWKAPQRILSIPNTNSLANILNQKLSQLDKVESIISYSGGSVTREKKNDPMASILG